MYSIWIGIIFVVIGIVIGIIMPNIYESQINRILERDCQNDSEHTTTYRKSRKDYIMLGTISGVAYYMLFLKNGISNGNVTVDGVIITALYCICTSLLLALVVIDWNTYEIPPGINVCILLLGLIRIGLDYENWSLYVIGFFAVSGFLYLLYRISGGTWIGGGDVKLMAAAGLLLGWKLIVVAFVVGCVFGSVIHIAIMAIEKGERMLAFGPYLSLGIYLSMLWGEQLASWYLSLLKI